MYDEPDTNNANTDYTFNSQISFKVDNIKGIAFNK